MERDIDVNRYVSDVYMSDQKSKIQWLRLPPPILLDPYNIPENVPCSLPPPTLLDPYNAPENVPCSPRNPLENITRGRSQPPEPLQNTIREQEAQKGAVSSRAGKTNGSGGWLPRGVEKDYKR